MNTTRPISSISYNSSAFLIQQLNTLISLGIISYYEFIEHFPDEDDKKKHIHLICFPAKRINLTAFGDYFIEKDINNYKPLKCMPFRVSDYGNWYWYSIHNKDYLKSKLLTRNCFYNDINIISSDNDFHRQLVIENPLINFSKMSDMMLREYVCECVNNGVTLHSVLSSGLVPLGKTQSVITLYNALFSFVDNQEKKRLIKVKKSKEYIQQKFNLMQPTDKYTSPFDDYLF